MPLRNLCSETLVLSETTFEGCDGGAECQETGGENQRSQADKKRHRCRTRRREAIKNSSAEDFAQCDQLLAFGCFGGVHTSTQQVSSDTGRLGESD